MVFAWPVIIKPRCTRCMTRECQSMKWHVLADFCKISKPSALLWHEKCVGNSFWQYFHRLFQTSSDTLGRCCGIRRGRQVSRRPLFCFLLLREQKRRNSDTWAWQKLEWLAAIYPLRSIRCRISCRHKRWRCVTGLVAVCLPVWTEVVDDFTLGIHWSGGKGDESCKVGRGRVKRGLWTT